MASTVGAVERLAVAGAVGNIEVSLHRGDSNGPFHERKLVGIVSHPHPLYGGTMDNKVVTTLVRVHNQLGITAARFNFRGVGGSVGVHDNGRGEVLDLLAVADWLRDRRQAEGVLLAGFSFGAAVAAVASLKVADIRQLTLVAPPLANYSLDDIERFPCPVCVVVGDRDEVVDPNLVCRWAEGLSQPRELVRLADASHFFHGQLVALRTEVEQALLRQLD